MTTFQQIKPGPRPADEPNGSSDILNFYNLRRLHDLTQSGTFVAQQQEQARAAAAAAAAAAQRQQGSSGGGGGGIPGDARLWKRGPATGLFPLALKPAPAVPAGSRPPMPLPPLARALAALEGGPWAPSDGARGELVAEGAGEESAAAVLLPAAAVAAAAAAAGGGGVKKKEEEEEQGAGRGGVAAAAAGGGGAAPPPATTAAGAPSPSTARPAAGKIKIKVKLGPKK